MPHPSNALDVGRVANSLYGSMAADFWPLPALYSLIKDLPQLGLGLS
ncbi:MAG: hypothetical protein ACE5HS_20845 [bacterium]